MQRRKFLQKTGLLLSAKAWMPLLATPAKSMETQLSSWDAIRSEFNLVPDRIHMAQMLLSSHPKQVRDAIERHRTLFDENPVEYWEEHAATADNLVREACAKYIGADPAEIALTDSTTMGLGLVYHGLKLNPGDEILTTVHDHYSTEKSLEFAAMKNGAEVRRVVLYRDPSTATVDELVGSLKSGITPKTRVIAATWVHSNTGMKLPIKAMSDMVKEVNNNRGEKERILFCVDGVHGFGIENITMEEMGCDFFVAGTHKWLFGPRGTGIVWGKKEAWERVSPIVPSFDLPVYYEWLGLVDKQKLAPGEMNTPGGFHSFEHRWALGEAFHFHMGIGKDRVEWRTHKLNSMLKEEFQQMKHVKLKTPVSPALSSGITCFEVAGLAPSDVVKILFKRRIIASASPYRVSYVRLTPCIINSEEEVKVCLAEVENLKLSVRD